MTPKAPSKLKLLWTAASLNWLWHAWLKYGWQAGIFSTETEQMQIIRCCHMKNYFNLKEYLVHILVLFIGNFSRHGEEAQPHQDDASKNTLGTEWVVLWHWIETKSSSWAEHLMDTCGLTDILGVSASAELWRLQSLEQLVIKYWRLLKGKYLVKNLWSHLHWAFSLF